MLYREIMAVCSQIHTKHINTLCGQNVELLNVKLAVHIVTTGLQRVKSSWHLKLFFYYILKRVIKSSRMRWAGDVARMWERRGEAYTWF